MRKGLRSRAALTLGDQHGGGFYGHDLQVEPKGLGPGIANIQGDHFHEGRFVLAAHLPQPCQTRQRVEPRLLPGTSSSPFSQACMAAVPPGSISPRKTLMVAAVHPAQVARKIAPQGY